MNKQDLLKLQTCVLRVNIDCDGCKQKVRKLLQKIDGVYSTKIDAETGKVTVMGNVDPTKLVKKLEKAGKHTEIWSFQNGSSNSRVQIDNSKVGQNKNKNNNNNTAHYNGGKGQMGNSFKDPRAMAMAAPPKDQKSVKFNLPEEEFDVSDDEFDDEFDDEYDDGSSDDDDDDDEHEFHHGNHMPNKMMGIPVMGKHHGAHGPDGTINIHAINNNKKGGVGPNKKGGVIDVPIESKGKTGKGESKKGNNGGKKEGGGGGSGDGKKGGKGKKEGKSGGGFLGFGKKRGGLFGLGRKGCKGGGVDNCTKKCKKSGGKHENGPKKSGAKKDGPIEFNPPENGLHDEHVLKPMKAGKGNGGAGKGNGGGGSGGRKTSNANGHSNIFGAMGPSNGLQIPLGPMANVNGHAGHMGNIPALQGLPEHAMMNGGYYQGVGPGNPYNQQYMAMMMMNQQRANGNDMYQPMMFGRPFPPANYSMMPPISPAPADNYSHFFSDENANSCSIM